jgi:hypothetical protein
VPAHDINYMLKNSAFSKLLQKGVGEKIVFCPLLLSINASLFPEYCRIENYIHVYIHVVRSATLHLQLKIKTFQKCTIKNKLLKRIPRSYAPEL